MGLFGQSFRAEGKDWSAFPLSLAWLPLLQTTLMLARYRPVVRPPSMRRTSRLRSARTSIPTWTLMTSVSGMHQSTGRPWAPRPMSGSVTRRGWRPGQLQDRSGQRAGTGQPRGRADRERHDQFQCQRRHVDRPGGPELRGAGHAERPHHRGQAGCQCPGHHPDRCRGGRRPGTDRV